MPEYFKELQMNNASQQELNFANNIRFYFSRNNNDISITPAQQILTLPPGISNNLPIFRHYNITIPVAFTDKRDLFDLFRDTLIEKLKPHQKNDKITQEIQEESKGESKPIKREASLSSPELDEKIQKNMENQVPIANSRSNDKQTGKFLNLI